MISRIRIKVRLIKRDKIYYNDYLEKRNNLGIFNYTFEFWTCCITVFIVDNICLFENCSICGNGKKFTQMDLRDWNNHERKIQLHSI